MKETIYMNRNEELLAQIVKLQQMQRDFDKKKKQYRNMGRDVRRMGQKIPEMIRQLKCNAKR